MKPTSRRRGRWSAILLLIVAGAMRLSAQYAHFANDSDTIAVSGGTTISSSAMTMEAVFVLSVGSPGGGLYFEEVSGLEHKQIALSATALFGFAFTSSVPTGVNVPTTVSLNVPHHFAFVQSSARRLFLDGLLVYEDFNAGASISNSPTAAYPTAIGASYYDVSDIFSPSFIGYLDSIRVSDTARYSGNFTAPTGDMTSDGFTQLLYNFVSGEVVGGVVQDMSGNGHSGTLGTGFTGATAPTIVTAVPEPAAYAVLMGLACLAASMRRRLFDKIARPIKI